MNEEHPHLNRQAVFTVDGRVTSVPTKLTEKPNLEKQGTLADYWETVQRADAWLRTLNADNKGGEPQ